MILERLKKVYEAITGKTAGDFTESSLLREDLEMDSVLMLYMAIALEEEFSITVDNTIVNSVKTVGDMIKYIEEKQA